MVRGYPISGRSREKKKKERKRRKLETMGRSIMISNATNPLKESRKESQLRCACSTSICVWLVCDLVVMCVSAGGDRALGDLCVCVRCGSVQSQKV